MGRQLQGISGTNLATSYKYNENGLRTEKTGKGQKIWSVKLVRLHYTSIIKKTFWSILALIVILVVLFICYPMYLKYLISDIDGVAFLNEKTLADNEFDYELVPGPISFRSPWGSVIDTYEIEDNIRYNFSSDVSVAFAEREMLHLTLVDSWLRPQEKRCFYKLYGSNISNYELRKVMFQTTPDMLSFRNSVPKNTMLFKILSATDMSPFGNSWDGVYFFETQHIAGFQSDALDSLTKYFEIYFRDTMFLMIVHGGTQAEVDYFLANLGKDCD